MKNRIPVLIAKASPTPKVENINGKKVITNYVHTGAKIKVPLITQQKIDYLKAR